MGVMERKKIWFIVSGLLLVPGIISLLVWHLRLGIDFKGGSLAEYQVVAGQGSAASESAAMTKIYNDEGAHDPQIQITNQGSNQLRIFVKSVAIDETHHRNIVRRLGELKPSVKEISFDNVDPQVGRDVTNKAFLAVALASVAIIIYIALSFRGVPKPASSWQFGIFAVVALLHDVLFIIGFYSIMGHFFGYEVQSEFITAALTVMGFSVHDTIVVFDRLRENLKRFPSYSFTQVANISVVQTLSRSINTSLTVLLTLLAVVLLGGSSIRPFTLTLLVGIAVGTYSSIFVATPLLDWWQNRPKKVKGSIKKKREVQSQPAS